LNTGYKGLADISTI